MSNNSVINIVVKVRDGASGPMDDVGDAVEGAGRQARQTGTRFTELNSKLELAMKAGRAAAAAFKVIAKPLIGVGVAGVGAGAQMEKFGSQLTILMNNAGAAEARLEKLFEIGSTTPFQLPDLIEAEVNLRTLGVEAEKVLPMVMDFAGVMGTDLASSAVEVGRAMQFGAGAVRSMGGRALATQVKIRTGMDPLKMSVKEFREELELALTDKHGMFAGGTAKLAATFTGLVSNMQDAWFKFSKQVADAGAFGAAKAIVAEILTLLGENAELTQKWADVMGRGVARSMIFVFEVVGRIAETFAFLQKSTFLVGAGIDKAIVIPLAKLNRLILTFRGEFKELIGTFEEGEAEEFNKKIMQTYADVGAANKRIKETIFERLPALEDEENKLRKIRESAERLEKALKEGRFKRVSKATDEKGRQVQPMDMPEITDVEDPAEAEAKAAKEAAALAEKTAKALAELEQTLNELPGKIAEGFTGALSDPSSTFAKALGPAGGVVTAISEFGSRNPKQIAKEFRGFFKNIVRAFTTVLPELIVMIPQVLINQLPRVLTGVFKALPKLIGAVVFKLPAMLINVFGRWLVKGIGGFFNIFINKLPKKFFQALKRWFKGAIQKIKDIFKPGKIFRPETEKGRRRLAVATLGISEVVRGTKRLLKGGKQTGGFIQSDGFQYLHAGERVVPPTGASTSSMMQAAGNIGGGQTINIHTNVVDSNSIRALGILLDREFGSRGRSRGFGLFNDLEALAGRL